MQINIKDLLSGAVFVSFGVFYGVISIRTLDVGAANAMGPGYFPLVLCVVLLVLGAIVGVRSFSATEAVHIGKVAWRPIICIALACFTFGASVRAIGLFPGIFLATFIASVSSAEIGLTRAAMISGAIAAFCTIVFSFGVGLPIPAFGPLFTF